MSFDTPLALLALLLVPLLLGAYLWQLRRKRKSAVQFSHAALVRAALPKRNRWRQHVPVALFLAAIAGLAIASARPQVSATVPRGRTSIILALDVSRSMCATDVPPNRLTVAQQAAREFVNEQVAGTRIGIVAFAGFAELIQPPTTDKQKLIDAINNLTTSRGTVIGAAELKAIDAIAAENPDVAPIGPDVNADPNAPTAPPSSTATPPTTTAGSSSSSSDYVPDIVVLLTDGANTQGIDPITAAQQAANRKIRVYTIGFGTENPTSIVCSRDQLGADAFDDGGGGGFFGGGGGPPAGGGGGFGRFLVIDTQTLQTVADMTGGTFHTAQDADQLKSVFAKLPNQITLTKEKHEITVVFALFGALFVLGAIGLSLLWNRSP